MSNSERWETFFQVYMKRGHLFLSFPIKSSSHEKLYNVWHRGFASGKFILTLSAPTPQNGQTQSNNSSAIADELFEFD